MSHHHHSDASKSLGTCINCEKHSYSSYGKSERLCDRCLKKLPRVICDYCQKDFHQLMKYAKRQKELGKLLCPECIDDQKIYGDPKNCEYCNVQAAFYGTKCTICSKSEKTYGKPKMCEECLRYSAFDKGHEALEKTGGRNLCFLCTRNYKRKIRAHEKAQEANKKRDRDGGDESFNGSSKKRSGPPPPPLSPPPPPPHSHGFGSFAGNGAASSSSISGLEPNWRVLYEDKESHAQNQATEFHASLQESRHQIAELTKQVEDAHSQILQRDREAASFNLKIHELEKDLHNSREAVKSLQQEAVALRAELREKRPAIDRERERDRDRERERDREKDRRDRERERERDRRSSRDSRDRRDDRDRGDRGDRGDRDRDRDRVGGSREVGNDNLQRIQNIESLDAGNGKFTTTPMTNDVLTKKVEDSYEDQLDNMEANS